MRKFELFSKASKADREVVGLQCKLNGGMVETMGGEKIVKIDNRQD